jgi:hypothetical protein
MTRARRIAVALAGVALLAGVAVVWLVRGHDVQDDGSALVPLDPYDELLDRMEIHRLVALGDLHMCQQFHDVVQTLLRQPALPDRIDDIVVEFGNALYQDVADRYIVELQSVPDDELAQIWRNTIGGRTYWDAPVYEQVFRTVRTVNEALPPDQRIRVVLGDPDVDFSTIRSVADRDQLPGPGQRDTFFADVVEREVLARDRRALLIIGGDHLHRNEATNDAPDQPNAGTLLAQKHPADLFVVENLPYDALGDTAVRETAEAVPASWERPSLALLEGTWLGAQPVSFRALEPGLTFADRVDAVLWLGPEQTLTASQPDPALYQSGEYAAELRRRSEILTEIQGQPLDLVAEGLAMATANSGLDDGREAIAEIYAQ